MSGAADGDRERLFGAVVASIPAGRVATYGQVAGLAGWPGRARQVGRFLSELPADSDLPWHRVVNARGAISPRESEACRQQARLLRREGVDVDVEGRLDLRRFRWVPELIVRERSRRRRS